MKNERGDQVAGCLETVVINTVGDKVDDSVQKNFWQEKNCKLSQDSWERFQMWSIDEQQALTALPRGRGAWAGQAVAARGFTAPTEPADVWGARFKNTQNKVDFALYSRRCVVEIWVLAA